MKSRVRAWKIVLALAGAVALLFGSFFAYGQIKGAQRWAEMESHVRNAPSLKPNASEPLAALLSTLPGVDAYDDGWRQLAEFREGKRLRDRARAETLLNRHLPTLEAVRRFARQVPGPRVSRIEGKSITALERLAIGRSIVLSEAQDVAEAAETLRDAALVFLSLAGKGHDALWPLSAVDGMLKELALLVRRGLSTEAWRALGADLEALDRGWPDTVSVEIADVMDLGLEFVNSGNLFSDLRTARCMCSGHTCPLWGAWRFGFSDRWMAARAFEEALSFAELSASVRTAPWSEARRIRDEIRERMVASHNPIVLSHVAPLLGFDVNHREILARLRMLRLAAAVGVGEDPPVLEDPFGAVFGRKGLRFWSAGRDGVDDGGHTGKDLVLDMERE